MALVRRPCGALEVACSIASVSSSLYGNSDSMKYVMDGDVSIQLNCVSRIIQNLDVEHFAGHLINDIVQNHHQVYGCSTKSLLAMISLLASSAIALRDQGLPDETVLKGLHQAIELCVANFKSRSVKSFFKSLEYSAKLLDSSDKETQDSSQHITNTDAKSVPCRTTHTLNNTAQSNLSGVRGPSFDSDLMHHPVPKTEMVKLKLKPLQQIDSKDEDDLSWYFNESENSHQFSIDDAVINGLNTLLDVHSDLTHLVQNDGRSIKSSISQVLINDKPSIMDVKISSLKDIEPTNDFDDCFDESDSKPIHIEESSLPAGTTIYSPIPPGAGHIEGEEKDEFDDCFDGIHFQKHGPKLTGGVEEGGVPDISRFVPLTSSPDERRPIVQEKDIECEDYFPSLEPDFTCPQISSINQSKDPSSNHGEISPSQIPSQVKYPNRPISPREQVHSDEITNSNVPLYAFQGSTETEKVDLLHKISEILARKKETRKIATKNYSRHFKTDQSSLESMQSTPPPAFPVICQPSVTNNCIDEKYNRTFTEGKCFERYDGVDTPSTSHQSEHVSPKDEVAQSVSVGTNWSWLPKISDTPLEQPTSTDDKPQTANLERKLEEILASKPRLNISKLQRGSRHCTSDGTSFVGTTDITPKDQLLKPQDTRTCSGSGKNHPLPEDNCKVTTEKLEIFTRLLGHGALDATKLVASAVVDHQPLTKTEPGGKGDYMDFRELSLDVARIHSLCIAQTPSSRSEVVDGFLVPCSNEQLHFIQSSHQGRRALLINGDVGFNFRHKGMNKKVETNVVAAKLSPSNRKQRWLDTLTSTIDEMSIEAILVKGNVCSDLEDWCWNRGVVVLSDVPSRVLLGIAEATDRLLSTYLSECTEDNVVEWFGLEVWRTDWMDQIIEDSHGAYVRISVPQNVFQTIVVCHPSGERAAVIEEQCWHILHRWQNVLKTERYMYGCPERYLCHVLDEEADRINFVKSPGNEDHEMIPFVLRTVAEGFKNLEHLVYCNITGQNMTQLTQGPWRCSGNTDRINVSEQYFGFDDNEFDSIWEQSMCSLDDCLSKIEAYRSALCVVRQLMLTDFEIITGIERLDELKDSDIIGTL